MASDTKPIVLFGYESSPFTWKIRFALRLKQVSYTFVEVPSMMPRPLLREMFNLTYRKIPILAIGRELYCDTSIILEALEEAFSSGISLYPPATDGRTNRSLIRGYGSYWTDRPFFRVATGLMPGSVWRSRFGADRSGLIGHKLDAKKLNDKVPRNIVDLDLQFSLIEPQLEEARQSDPRKPWIFSTQTPSLADISLYYQMNWARDIAAGRGINNLTGGATPDTDDDITKPVFNEQRYPGIWHWFDSFSRFMETLPPTETKIVGAPDDIMDSLRSCAMEQRPPTIKTPAELHNNLSNRIGLSVGQEVRVAPDDTGRNDPVFGTLVALTPEEIVLEPRRLELASKDAMQVRIHFPRLGFVILPTTPAKL